MSYLNSITLVGFVGSDPEQRQAKGNGSKFTVLSIATQRSWKNADDEWSSKTEWHRVVVFRPLLAERVATTIKKGRSRTRRRLSRQLDLRTTERQRQEIENHEDYVVVDSCRRRPQARSRRAGAASARFRDVGAFDRIFGRRNILRPGVEKPSGAAGGLFFFSVRPELRSKKDSSPAPLRFPV
jgi:single stranded DNA-binding protein